MASTKLYPNSILETTNATVTGAADAAAAMDASTSSYFVFTTTSLARVRADVTDYTLGANRKIDSVRVVVKYDTVTAGGTQAFHLALQSAGGTYLDLTGPVNAPTATMQTIISPITYKDPDGNDWTDPLADAIRIALWDDATFKRTKVYEAYIEVLDYAQPTISGLTAYFDSLGRPYGSWTPNCDGLVQSYRQVKVFSEATALAGGFDPETTTPICDSGVQAISSTTKGFSGNVPANTFTGPDGNYRYYVKIASVVNNQKYWSNWSYATLTLDQAPYTPHLLSPLSALDGSGAVTFTWDFTHPSVGTQQGAWAFRRKINGGSYQYWRESDQTWQSTVQWNTGTSTSKTFSAGQFANGQVLNWSVAVQDPDGDASAFATDVTFTFNAAPALSFTAPGATITDTTRPTISWVYTDAEGDAQDRWQVRVFDAATYGAAGFDPELSPALTESGIGIGPTSSWAVPVDLLNGAAYRAYARISAAGQWSAWVYAAFTMSLDLPATPTVVVTANPDGGYVLDIQGHDNLLTANEASIETSAAGWANASNAGSLTQVTDGVHGTKALEFKSLAAGNASVQTPTGTSGHAVTAGKVYTARAAVKPTTNARAMRVKINWYNSSGTLLSTSTGSNATTTLSTWLDSASSPSVTATAPAGAAFANVVVEAISTAAANETFRIDKIGLCNGSAAADVWSTGGRDLTKSYALITETQENRLVRPSTGSPFDANQFVSVTDSELMPYAGILYLVVVTAPLGGQPTNLVAGTGTIAVPSAWQPKHFWLRDIPLYNGAIEVIVDAGSNRLQRPIKAGVYYPEGSDRAVVVSEPNKRGYEGPLSIWVSDGTTLGTLDALLIPGQTLLLTDPAGYKLYFQVTGDVEYETLRSSDPAGTYPRNPSAKHITVPIVEVAIP